MNYFLLTSTMCFVCVSAFIIMHDVDENEHCIVHAWSKHIHNIVSYHTWPTSYFAYVSYSAYVISA